MEGDRETYVDKKRKGGRETLKKREGEAMIGCKFPCK